MTAVNGLHHITAIAGPPQENLEFYAGVLGMRLVKRSVNQDDPGTYHFFFADADGHPGSDLTFFPWTQPAPPRRGHGLAVEVALEVPVGSLSYWSQRLSAAGTPVAEVETRFDDRVLTAIDPHGLRLAFIEPATPRPRRFTPWERSGVDADLQIRGLYGARVWERSARPSAAFLVDVLGFEELGSELGWTRFGFAGHPGVVDIREAPDEGRGAWGVGAVHHLAWRVDDDAHQQAMRAGIERAGARPTPVIDRFWFKSVYFQEPGGVLFELATEGPGFAADEDRAHLGEQLILPPWLESRREAIEATLPPVTLPALGRV